MHYPKILSLSLLTPLLVLAGCTTQTTMNTNVVTNTNTTNDSANAKVVTNTNDSNVNTDIDISDWLTYTNEEYGFSFRYPNNWQISKDIFEVYKESYDNPRYQINKNDVVFLTALTNTEVDNEIEKYQNRTNEIGSGVIESIGRGKLVSVSVSEKNIADLISQPGFTFTIGDTQTLSQDIEATNVYLQKTWEGNSNYHDIYIPFQSNATTNMEKQVRSVVFSIETKDGNYDQNILLQMVKTFQKNS